MDFSHIHDTISVYSCILTSYVSNVDKFSSQIRNTPFHSKCAPSLSIKDFVERIYRYFNCSAECYLLSLIYINRVIRINRFIINAYSVHRLILTSMMVAAKYFDDVYYTNTFYAEVGGISVNEINSLEVDFLCRIGFNLFVSTEEFRQYYKDIADHCSNCFTCYSIRLPELINCGPKGEAPILRYRETPSNTNFSYNGMFSSNMGTFSGYGYPSSGGYYSGYSFGSNQGMLASMNYASMASYASDLGNITPTYQVY